MADTAVAYLSREFLFIISIISRSSPRVDLVAFVLLDLLPFTGIDFNIMGSIRFHCSFVSSILIFYIIRMLCLAYFEMASSDNTVKLHGPDPSNDILDLV